MCTSVPKVRQRLRNRSAGVPQVHLAPGGTEVTRMVINQREWWRSGPEALRRTGGAGLLDRVKFQ